MHAMTVLVVMVLLALVTSPVTAQDADAIRRELEQMRRSFGTMKQEYQKSMDAPSDRLKRLESTPAPTAVAPAPPATQAVQAAPPENVPGSPISPMDLLRPRQPFSLYGQRGSGQLLFDIGMAGDFFGGFAPPHTPKPPGRAVGEPTKPPFPPHGAAAPVRQVGPVARAPCPVPAGR